MEWIEQGILIILTIQGANTMFLWSLHGKVTKLVTQREACAFCQSDTSTTELQKMKQRIES